MPWVLEDAPDGPGVTTATELPSHTMPPGVPADAAMSPRPYAPTEAPPEAPMAVTTGMNGPSTYGNPFVSAAHHAMGAARGAGEILDMATQGASMGLTQATPMSRNDTGIPGKIAEIVGGTAPFTLGAGAVGMGAKALGAAPGLAGLVGDVGGGALASSGTSIGTNIGKGEPIDLPAAAGNAAIGAGGGALAHGLGRLLGAGKPDISGNPTNETIGQEKNAAYDNAKSLGAAYHPDGFSNMVQGVAGEAEKADINPLIHPKSDAFISTMQNIADFGKPVSLTRLDQLRQAAGRDLGGSSDAGERFFGQKIKSGIDDFINNPATPMATGSGPDAAAAMAKARDLAQRDFKNADLQEAIGKAQDLASKNETGNLQKAMRDKMYAFKYAQPNLSQDEKSLVQRGISGSPVQNMLRYVGKVSPTNFFPMVGEIAGASSGFPGVAAALAGAGTTAKFAANAMEKQTAKQLANTILAGGKTPQATDASTAARLAKALMQSGVDKVVGYRGTGEQ